MPDVLHPPSLALVSHPTRWSSMVAGLTIAVTLAFLVACGGTSKAAPAATSIGAGTAVKVVLTDMMLTPDRASVPAGAVTFAVANTGSIPHEFVLLKTDLAANSLMMEATGSRADEAGAAVNVGEIADFAAGTTETTTMDLAAGHYVMVCNIDGHYMRGMRADFTVTAP